MVDGQNVGPQIGVAQLPSGMVTDWQIDDIFATQILPYCKFASQANPTVLLIVGQPGSGKTSAERSLLRNLNLGNTVSIDGDDFYCYHPDFEALSRCNDIAALRQCQNVSSRLSFKLREYATQARCNIAMPMFVNDSNSDRISHWRSQGYRVQMAFVAVDDLRSKQAVIARYLDSRKSVGYGRMATHDMDNREYGGVLKIADLADTLLMQYGYLDAVHVVRRGGQILETRSGPMQTSTREVIEAERRRPWTREEGRVFIETQERIENLAAQYDGGDRYLLPFVSYVRERAQRERFGHIADYRNGSSITQVSVRPAMATERHSIALAAAQVLPYGNAQHGAQPGSSRVTSVYPVSCAGTVYPGGAIPVVRR